MSTHFQVVNSQDTGVCGIVDTFNEPPRVIASSEVKSDADFIVSKLNMPFDKVDSRRLQAWSICDFRLKLEHENGDQPLDDPSVAFLLADLCTFLGFNTYETALALGPQMLSTVEAQDLAEISVNADVIVVR